MKVLLVVVAALLSIPSFASGNTPVPPALGIAPGMLKFTYQTHDGELTLPCQHVLKDADAQDWEVTCADASGKNVRRYTVHLWVTAYPHENSIPRVSYEVLYWVTDLSQTGKAQPSSTTFWFNMKEMAALDSLRVSLGVEGDTAGLRLELKTP